MPPICRCKPPCNLHLRSCAASQARKASSPLQPFCNGCITSKHSPAAPDQYGKPIGEEARLSARSARSARHRRAAFASRCCLGCTVWRVPILRTRNPSRALLSHNRQRVPSLPTLSFDNVLDSSSRQTQQPNAPRHHATRRDCYEHVYTGRFG